MAGRLAQRESTPFTREGSQVQSLHRPPFNFPFSFFGLCRRLAARCGRFTRARRGMCRGSRGGAAWALVFATIPAAWTTGLCIFAVSALICSTGTAEKKAKGLSERVFELRSRPRSPAEDIPRSIAAFSDRFVERLPSAALRSSCVWKISLRAAIRRLFVLGRPQACVGSKGRPFCLSGKQIIMGVK